MTRKTSVTAPRARVTRESARARELHDVRAALAHVRASDPVLARVMDLSIPFELPEKPTQSMFVALAEAIVYQQLHGKAAATIFARVCALCPRGVRGLTPERVLLAQDDELRGAGLSRAKLAALRDLAAKTRANEIPTLARARRMSDDEIVAQLARVRGIGRWTAEMLLMFRLRRPDVLPADDFGVRKGFKVAYGKRDLPSRTQLVRHAERWRPYRTVGSWYMWRATELDPRDLRPVRSARV
ncbi:MAG: DNA-3-methyladenine glycosylase family protein [Planctomycetota bacterium]